MGRKPLSDEAKTAQLRILLTNDERSRMDAAAAIAQKGTSTWARDELLQAAEKQTAAQQPATKPASPAKRKAAKKA